MDYITTASFTTANRKAALVQEGESTSAEEFPMICFLVIETNPRLEEWTDQTLE